MSVKTIKIFVSSVIGEFEDERKKIKEEILNLSPILSEKRNIILEPILMEDHGAKSEPPLDFCISKVKECDIFICIIGKVYGSIARDGLSYTHIEYRTAYDEWVKSGKNRPEIRIYVLKIDEKKDVREEKVKALINEVKGKHYLGWFKNSDELILTVIRDLIRDIFEMLTGGEKEFKLIFRKKLESCIKCLEETKGCFEEEMDDLIALIKKEIDSWNIKNVRFAIRELFLKLHKYEGLLLHNILEDLYLRAYNQRLRLFDSMVHVFQDLWIENWIGRYDIELFEKIADVLLRLGIKFLDIDVRATRTFISVIDNMAGDVFEKEVLGRLVIFSAILLGRIGRESEKMDLFIDLLRWIEDNDKLAWDDEYYSYLIDSVEYAYQIQKEYNVNIDSFVNSFIEPVISRIKDRKLNGFIGYLKDSIEEELHGEDFIDYDTEYLVRIILSYKKAFQDIADQIKQKILETNDEKIIDRFNKIISRSNFLKKVYRGGNMITTVDDFIKFLKGNSDLSSLIGIEAWGHAFITFKRKLTDDDKRRLEELAKEYELTDDLDFEIENEYGISFLVDKIVGKENNIDSLVDIIQKLNNISEIEKISISLSFKFE